MTSLSPGYLGVLSAPAAIGHALRAQELSLVSKVERLQRMLGEVLGEDTPTGYRLRVGRHPASVDVRVAWRPADQSSLAQASDAVVKLHSAGLLRSRRRYG